MFTTQTEYFIGVLRFFGCDKVKILTQETLFMSESLGPTGERDSATNDNGNPELEAAEADAIARNTKPLTDRIARGDLEPDAEAELVARARQVVQSVEDNPARVLQDASKHRLHQSEHDIEKARLMALATDEAETAHDAFSASIDRKLVNDAYEKDPTVTPEEIEQLKEQARKLNELRELPRGPRRWWAQLTGKYDSPDDRE